MKLSVCHFSDNLFFETMQFGKILGKLKEFKEIHRNHREIKSFNE